MKKNSFLKRYFLNARQKVLILHHKPTQFRPMKKYLFFALALLAVACNNDKEDVHREWVTVDFEQGNFKQMAATSSSSWSFMKEGYNWIDPSTSLYHEAKFTNDYGYAMFGSGLVISSYNTFDVESFGTYESDLYVYHPSTPAYMTKGGGADGSDHFLISYGNYEPEVDAELDMRPAITFSDGKARMVKGCQVNCTTYFINVAEKGNPYSPALKDGEQIKIYATGYDAAGREGKTVEMTIARKGKIIKEWTAWDLTALGEVVSVKFNIKGGNTDEWGMTTPKYFAIDNIVVEKK